MNRITFNSLAIPVKKIPKADLSDCLNTLVKEDLAVMGINYGVKITMSKLKNAMVAMVAEQVMTQLKERVKYSGVRTLSALTRLMNGTVTLEELEENSALLAYLQMEGWSFFFECEEELTIVIPEEIRTAYREVLSDPETVDEIREISEYRDYALALVSLYGVCPKDQLIKVWETHNQECLDSSRAFAIIETIAKYCGLFYISDECLISVELKKEEEVKTLLKAHAESGYYLPMKEEILGFADELALVCQESEAEQKLKEHLFKVIPKESIGEVITMMHMEAKMLPESHDVMECLNEYKVSFATKQEAESFKDAFNEWYGLERKWFLGGYTLFEKWQNKESAVKGGIRRGEKIGRNTLCPCGSKKKYKHCCGR